MKHPALRRVLISNANYELNGLAATHRAQSRQTYTEKCQRSGLGHGNGATDKESFRIGVVSGKIIRS